MCARYALCLFLVTGCAPNNYTREPSGSTESQVTVDAAEEIALQYLRLTRSDDLEVRTERDEHGGWRVWVTARQAGAEVFNVVTVRSNGSVAGVFRSL